MIELLALILAISGLLVGLCAAGVIAALISAAVWHFFPSCAFSLWLKDEVFHEVDASSIKSGGCISPKTHTLGDSHGSL